MTMPSVRPKRSSMGNQATITGSGGWPAAFAMSERHFQRRFVEQVGMTPGKYVAEIRFEAARRALEESNDPVAAIAARTGFGTAESMRRTFVQRIGAPPDSYRRHFTTIAPTASIRPQPERTSP